MLGIKNLITKQLYAIALDRKESNNINNLKIKHSNFDKAKPIQESANK